MSEFSYANDEGILGCLEQTHIDRQSKVTERIYTNSEHSRQRPTPSVRVSVDHERMRLSTREA
jgi:hypothetical protein